MGWFKSTPPLAPGEWEKKQAEICRTAACRAREENDEDHAKELESRAYKWEAEAVYKVRKDREKRAGVL